MTVSHVLAINQGEDYSFKVQWVGADFTGATAKMQIRTAPASQGGTILATFASPSTGIVFSTSTGAVNPDTATVTITAAQSAAWTFTSGVYDLELTLASGTVKRLVQGAVRVSQQVTV